MEVSSPWPSATTTIMLRALKYFDMCSRAMQLITNENCNVIELPIYLLPKFVPSPSGHFDKISFGMWQQLQTQRKISLLGVT